MSDYDPGRFYVGSTNKKGFHGAIRVAVPPEIAREISALVQSGKFPQYRTANDFTRDALVHRLGQLDVGGNETWTDAVRLHVLSLELEDLEKRKELVEKVYHMLIAGRLPEDVTLDAARKAIEFVDDDRKPDFQRVIDLHQRRLNFE